MTELDVVCGNGDKHVIQEDMIKPVEVCCVTVLRHEHCCLVLMMYEFVIWHDNYGFLYSLSSFGLFVLSSVLFVILVII